MNREHWKAMLPIITAFVEGKTVQFRKDATRDDIWVDAEIVQDDEVTVWRHTHWRIKPTPTLRPWKPEEVPVGEVVQPKNKSIRERILITWSCDGDVALNGNFHRSVQVMLDDYELLDGSPCGVEVSE